MAFLKTAVYTIIAGGVSYTLLRVVSPNEEHLVKQLAETRNFQKVDRTQQEQLLKILRRAARVPESMSKQDQGNASSTNSKLKSGTSKTEK